jgi:DNA-binding phage protein
VGDGSTTQKANTPVPFTEYRNVNKLPFTADYVDVKLTWDEADMVEDVTNIEEYLTELVHTGELDNSIVSAKEKLKKLEKMAGIDKFESTAQKLIKLSEFVTYLRNINKRKQWQA